jgi:hypothetical protein
VTLIPTVREFVVTAVIFCRTFGARRMDLDTLMLRKPRGSLKLFGTIDTTVFTVVLVVVVLILLIVSWTLPPHHHAASLDIPAVWHPVAMRGALRDDVMKVSVTRDGAIEMSLAQDGTRPHLIDDRIRLSPAWRTVATG